jgi:hypothetical protein
LRKSERKTWVIINNRFPFNSSQRQQQSIETFTKYLEIPSRTVYVNSRDVVGQ